MKQLLILSGKGGTGKTTVASAFIRLSKAKAYADCDVDAPNLHLTLKNTAPADTSDFYGLPVYEIDKEKCINCDICAKNCRFDAVEKNENVVYINKYACEGCGVCAELCPANAIHSKIDPSGKLMLYKNADSVFSTAQLSMGKGNSGMLVTEVKKQMKDHAAPDTDFAVIDGSPGIGCPVIASLSGADMVLIVCEPSVSGISDMQRIIKTAQYFNVKIAACVNKFDTNLENTKKIKEFCKREEIPFLGQIPYDINAVKAINNGMSIVDIDCPAGVQVKKIFHKTTKLMGGKTK